MMNVEISSFEKVKLEDIAEIEIGKTPSRSNKDYWGHGYSWVSISDMNGQLNLSETKEKITDKARKETNIRLVKKGTLLFSFKLSIGKVVFAGKDLYTNEAIAAIKVKENDRIFDKYLYYVLKEFDHSQSSDKAVKGKTLNKKKLKNLQIPLPPLETQKRIADILDKADALRQNDRLILQKYDQLAQSVFLDMFGDPYTNPKRFPIVTLDEIIVGGPQNGLYKASEYYGEGTPIVRIDSFYNSTVDVNKLKRVKVDDKELNRYEIKENDFLINRVNSPSHLGKCGLIPKLSERTVFESNMMRVSFDPKKVTSHFMLFTLSHPFMKIQILNSSKDAVNQSSINQKDVKNFKIPLPLLSSQKEFDLAIKSITNQQFKTESSEKKSNNLFQSLLQRAFKGELVN